MIKTIEVCDRCQCELKIAGRVKIEKLKEIDLSSRVKKCAYFIDDQPIRFLLLQGESCKTRFMYFCNRYLEAVFVKALYDGKAIYCDNQYYVVTSDK